MARLSSALLGCLLVGVMAGSASAQARSAQEQEPDQQTVKGTVVSSTRNALVVRTGEEDYEVFQLDSNTTRPDEIPLRAQVTVSYQQLDGEETPVADVVRITAQPAQGLGEPANEPVPQSVRRLEADIERQSRRYRLGIRGGSSLDPELFMIGVHSQLGPFFRENVWARPNLELGFGEITTLVALNFEGMYRLPVSPQRGRWSVYVGAGPALNFYRESFELESGGFQVEGEDRQGRFDFGNLDLDMGFNIFLGLQSRNGVSLELKSSAYARPRIRFNVGYNLW